MLSVICFHYQQACLVANNTCRGGHSRHVRSCAQKGGRGYIHLRRTVMPNNLVRRTRLVLWINFHCCNKCFRYLVRPTLQTCKIRFGMMSCILQVAIAACGGPSAPSRLRFCFCFCRPHSTRDSFVRAALLC